MKLCSL